MDFGLIPVMLYICIITNMCSGFFLPVVIDLALSEEKLFTHNRLCCKTNDPLKSKRNATYWKGYCKNSTKRKQQHDEGPIKTK